MPDDCPNCAGMRELLRLAAGALTDAIRGSAAAVAVRERLMARMGEPTPAVDRVGEVEEPAVGDGEIGVKEDA